VSNRILIVGTEGFLGGALLSLGHQRGLPVCGTRRGNVQHHPDIQRLDLDDDLARWSPPEHCAVAILCAAVTNLAACQRDPAGTRQINVRQTLRLTEKLVAAGSFVVFPSSNLVFDGTRPARLAADPTCPLTEYGRQKAAVESEFANYGSRVAIVRLTKVVNPHWPLIQGWIQSLRSQQPVEAFNNLVCAPIPLAVTVHGLLEIGQTRRAGIWQFSAASDVAYSDIARHIARRLCGNDQLIHSVSGADIIEHAPQHTTLDTTRARLELGLRFPPPLQAIEEAFGC